MKRLAILGSTGSIGRTTLDIVAMHGENLSVVALAAGKNWQLLAEQARRFSPDVIAIEDEESARALRNELGADAPRIEVGTDGLNAVATHPDADIVVSALTGGVGLVPTVEAIRASKDIALANKEVLVIAGEVVSHEAEKAGVRLLPVDSEISAIWQCLNAAGDSPPRRILLTASGGAFRNLPVEEFSSITPERALDHPTWVMGPKVTIDSATLMNKGFEILEVRWMFDMPLEKIEVLVHHQSIIHSLVEFEDGSLLAQLGVPDMTLPIQYAFTYPDRMPSSSERLDLAEMGQLTFGRPDLAKFPALRLAQEATGTGGTMPAVLSGADEVAVQAFLDRRLPFVGIPVVTEMTMERHSVITTPTLGDCIQAERWARETAESLLDAASRKAVTR